MLTMLACVIFLGEILPVQSRNRVCEEAVMQNSFYRNWDVTRLTLAHREECGKSTTDDSQDIPQYTCVEMLLWINGQCLGFTLSHVYHVVKELTVESRHAKEQTFCGDCCLIHFNFKLHFVNQFLNRRCSQGVIQIRAAQVIFQSSPVVEFEISYTLIDVFMWTSNWLRSFWAELVPASSLGSISVL